MKLMNNSESGQALVLALILLALGTLLVIPGLNLTTTTTRYHQLIQNKTVESYSADSGMEHALCKLYNAPGEYTDPENPLDETFDLNGRTVHIVGDYLGSGVYQLTSTATSPNGKSTTIRTVINLSAGVFIYAIGAKEDLDISGNTLVDSKPVSGNGDIASNGDITLVGNAYVKGDARAVGTITGAERIEGDPWWPAPAIVFPGDYGELYKTMAQEEEDIRPGQSISGGTHYLGPTYFEGDLTIGPNTYVILQGTIYVNGEFNWQGGLNGYIEGEYNIAVTGDVTMRQGYIRTELIPIITSTQGNITLVGPIVNAVVYAPNGFVSLTGLELNGAIGGKTVGVSNSWVYWAAMLNGREDLPGGELKTISYSYE